VFPVPKEVFQVILVVTNGIGGLALATAVEDVTLGEGFQTDNHLAVIQVIVSYFSMPFRVRFSFKSG
jgi:hypothetical protein